MNTTTKPKSSKRVDAVMAEVHRVKDELMKRFNYDVAAMFRDARERESKSGHKVVAPKKR